MQTRTEPNTQSTRTGDHPVLQIIALAIEGGPRRHTLIGHTEWGCPGETTPLI